MIVGTLSITETITWGIVYYGFAVFLTPMERDLGFSRVALTGAFSVGLAVSALVGVSVGKWIDRHGARSLMTVGSIAAVLLMVAWSRVETLLQLYVVWALMGLAMAATLYEPAFAAIIGWFSKHRDRALLTLTLAAGLASTIFVPIETWLLARMDWRTALVTLAVFLAVSTIPLHALLLRPPPAAPAAGPGAAPEGRSFALDEALRTVVFWVLTIAFVASNFAVNAVTVHVTPYLVGHGYPLATAAMTIGWIGAMQLVGRLMFGPIASRFGHRPMTAAVFVVQAVALALLASIRHVPTLIPMIVLMGAANGMGTLAR
ncbi:MAG TPA: MFS transporter, partial [Terriglobales bacterium]|nr:MFS transporter [Terriglobales bacterium]